MKFKHLKSILEVLIFTILLLLLTYYKIKKNNMVEITVIATFVLAVAVKPIYRNVKRYF